MRRWSAAPSFWSRWSFRPRDAPLDEVPEGFPAVVLWQFRMASLGAQAMLWTVLGLGFGAWVQRDFAEAKIGRLQTAY